MKYSARINILVKDPSVWNRLKELDPADIGFELPMEVLYDNDSCQLILDEESEWRASELQTSALCKIKGGFLCSPERGICGADLRRLASGIPCGILQKKKVHRRRSGANEADSRFYEGVKRCPGIPLCQSFST